ncbi:hypothetical protein Bca4012_027535 [Brassica carinata]|uniref:RNase H type-1 domain-containing protein n=1 Tax=Brassica carinata TaxID=52824 RepID=A0A8X7VL94_BRACI|nr:hypothetical protein Bca52824_024487 [Brassica carinata]
MECKLCRNGAETINHVLFQCFPAQEILREVHFPTLTASNRDLCENMKVDNGRQYNPGELAESYSMDAMDDLEESLLCSLRWYANIATLTQQSLDEVKVWTEVNIKGDSTLALPSSLEVNQRWQSPSMGVVKCNVNSNWWNASSLSGGAWITRNSQADVLHHERDAFTPSCNRLSAELKCIIWALQSLRDLGYHDIVIGSDNRNAIDALTNGGAWPRYRTFLDTIAGLHSSFNSVIFEHESTRTNSIARDIARSVLRDGRFRSYLALGGPAWLHNRIRNEALPNEC